MNTYSFTKLLAEVPLLATRSLSSLNNSEVSLLIADVFLLYGTIVLVKTLNYLAESG